MAAGVIEATRDGCPSRSSNRFHSARSTDARSRRAARNAGTDGAEQLINININYAFLRNLATGVHGSFAVRDLVLGHCITRGDFEERIRNGRRRDRVDLGRVGADLVHPGPR